MKPAKSEKESVLPLQGTPYAVLWFAVAILLCAPIWLPSLPPLSDYYNHLARLHIISHHDAVAEDRAFYRVEWDLYPNLGLELIGAPLLTVLSLPAAGKVFLTITVLCWHAGTTLLARAVYRRPTLRALIASFFIYNQQFLHGYCNFSLAMGLCLMALALWITSRHRWTLVRLALTTVIAGAAFLAHLFGFAVFAIAATAMTLSRLAARRRLERNLIVGLVPLVPCTALFATSLLSGSPAADLAAGAQPALNAGMDIAFAPVTYNARDALTLLTGYNQWLDMASVIVLVLVGLFIAFTRTRIALRRDLFVAGVVLGVLYWVFPADIATGQEVNVRFALGAFTLLFFALDIRLKATAVGALFLSLLLLCAIRTGTTAVYWLELDREFQAHLRAFETIEPGAALHNIYFYSAPRLLNARRVRTLSLIHTPSFAAVTRRANIPTLYGMRGWQPLSHKRALYRSHRFRDGSRPDIQWTQVFNAYHYVWTCRAPPDLLAPLAARAQILAQTRWCRLYRL